MSAYIVQRMYPHHAASFAWAHGLAALRVSQGLWAALEVERLLPSLFLPRPDDPAGGPRTYVIATHREQVRHFDVARHLTQRAVSRAIGHLIDARVDAATVYDAAVAADPECVMTARELRSVVAREQAWWVRLHAQLA